MQIEISLDRMFERDASRYKSESSCVTEDVMADDKLHFVSPVMWRSPPWE
jgi:hypothetical protein